MAIVNFVVGSAVAAFICLIILALNCCWYFMVYSRIPFAGANLGVASSALKQYPTLFAAAFSALVLNMVWVAAWSLAMLGVVKPRDVAVIETAVGSFEAALCSETFAANSAGSNDDTYTCHCDANDGDSSHTSTFSGHCPSAFHQPINGLAYSGMLISLYWGSTVVQNVMHCTTAGTVATWWFPRTAGGPSPVFDAFFRACTYSFGSVCLGSLLGGAWAILKAVRQVLIQTKGEKGKLELRVSSRW